MKRNLERVVAIADEPGDDEDLRLRKRVGVVAGYATIVAPLTLPIQAQGHPASILLGVAMSLFSIVNLFVLARDCRFDLYVVRLLGAGVVFVPLATATAGGMTGGEPGPGLGVSHPRLRHHGAGVPPGRRGGSSCSWR